MVTHDPRYAKYVERQVRLFDGQIVAEESQRRRDQAGSLCYWPLETLDSLAACVGQT